MNPIKADKLSVTSPYGKRTITIQGKKTTSFHKGIDLIANPRNNNAEIVAFEDGTVTAVVKTGKQYGTACYVRIKHKEYYTLYYHLKSGSIIVNKGDKVKKGQKLGIIGTTGKSTGVHLHFQIDKGTSATAINPYDYVFKDKELEKKEITLPKRGYFTKGDKDNDVKLINDWLYEKYKNKKTLGNVFGANTVSDIKKFQKEAKAKGIYTGTGATIDGNVGKLTLSAMRKDNFKY